MRPANILVITYWSFKDALIQTYTLPYLKLIKRNLPPASELFLVTLEQPGLRLSEDELGATSESLKREGVRLVPFNYSSFGLKAMAKWMLFLWKLWRLCRRERITHIHAWCTPAGAIGYLLSRLTGVPLIIDSYEPHAEAMVENGSWRKGGLAHRLLFLFEKMQSKRAETVIATTAGMKAYAKAKYGADIKSFYVKPACVDLELFSPAKKSSALLEKYELTDRLICVYAGKIGGIYLEKELFDFFKVASEYWGDRFRVLMLTNASRKRISELANICGLDPTIIVSKFVNHQDIPEHLGLGDFAINPVKPVPTKRYCTSIKDGEYWAMGLPVVIPDGISDDSGLIREHGIGAVLEEFTRDAYLNAVGEIETLLNKDCTQAIQDKIRAVAIRYRNFSDAEEIYRAIYQSTANH